MNSQNVLLLGVLFSLISINGCSEESGFTIADAPKEIHSGDAEAPSTPTVDISQTAEKTNAACGAFGRVLRSGQNLALGMAFSEGAPNDLKYAIIDASGNPSEQLGSLTLKENDITYTAPTVITLSQSFFVRVTSSDATTVFSDCKLALLADADIGVQDDGLLDGLVANVYELPINTFWLPDFSQMTAVSTMVVPNLDIPKRAFDTGFPGYKDLVEWFGIRFDGQLVVPQDGEIEFTISSDDGSKLYIDDQLVINNDGEHAVVAKSAKIVLTKGHHKIRVDYFQGPRYHMALQLFWKFADADPAVIVEQAALKRPK